MSLTELLVACVLMAFAFGAVGEIVVLSTNANTKLTNCIDSTTNADEFIDRISADVRAGSALGYPADSVTANNIITSYPSNFGTVNSGQTLIIQQPALINPTTPAMADLAGAPLMIPAGTFSSNPTMNVAYLNVVAYQLLADPGSPGQYEIQEIRYSGPAGSYVVPGTSLESSIPYDPTNPHIVLRGIVGPLPQGATPGSTLPVVFQTTPSNNGVFINLELESPIPNNSVNVHHVGVHSEAYLKCGQNAYASNFLPIQ